MVGGAKVRVGDDVLNGAELRDPIRYGGVETTEKENKILRLPANLKVPPPLRMEDIETEIEFGGAIAMFQELSRRREQDEQWNLEHCRLARDDPDLVQSDVRCRRPEVEFYNNQKKEINHRGLKPREMPNNKTATLPYPIEGGAFESKLQVLMTDLKNGAKRFIEEHCDKGGAQVDNLSREEQEGLNLLKKRRRRSLCQCQTNQGILV